MARPGNKDSNSVVRRRTGRDKLGRFVITGGPCSVCGAPDGFTIKYAPKSLAVQQEFGCTLEATILKSADNYIGLNCGCYGKLHRQVTHIKTRSEASGNSGK